MEYLTVAQAAKRLGYTPGAVRNLILRGDLYAVKVSPRILLIPPDAVETFRPRLRVRRWGGESLKKSEKDQK